MKRVLIAAMVLVLTAGCGFNSTFVYKPGAPMAGGAKLPVKIAVLPFKDGTEDSTKRRSERNPESLVYNLAKSGLSGFITALTPELWAKAFADEMAASGAFGAVRFFFSPSELTDEEFTIEGTLKKADYSPNFVTPNEFALGLRALRRTDNRLVWEKEVVRVWKTEKGKDLVDWHHATMNRAMREMFAEARADLVATLAVLSGSRVEEDRLPVVASPGEGRKDREASPRTQDSTEQMIDRILREK